MIHTVSQSDTDFPPLESATEGEWTSVPETRRKKAKMKNVATVSTGSRSSAVPRSTGGRTVEPKRRPPRSAAITISSGSK